MYHKYFGLREQAFSIAVNPRYLYMSDQHREALAHLLYGVKGGGFVLLSGEVGTGKTTIIRCLLEKLPDKTDIAIILNPMANVAEILSTICDELGVKVNSDASIKELTDALHAFLLDNHRRGRNTVLLIDEAQLLSPDVLEQIRLLTNLETSTKKLLQIVLVGQPELNELLSQPRLRQLSQRITARFHLKPLTLEETHAYINHRLAVAGMEHNRSPFTARIIKRIHSFTGGIPRLINILCERTLVGAYGHNKTFVDNQILQMASREVSGQPAAVEKSRSGDRNRLLAFTAFAALALALGSAISMVVFNTNLGDRDSPSVNFVQENSTVQPQAPAESVAENAIKSDDTTLAAAGMPAKPLKAQPAEGLPSQFSDYARAQKVYFNYLGATTESTTNPCWNNSQNLKCEQSEVENWQEVRKINRPMILTLNTPDKFVSYVVVVGISDSHALVLKGDNTKDSIPLAELGPQWTGEALYTWRSPNGYSEPIKFGDTGKTVNWVAKKFAEIDEQESLLADNIFTEELRQRVKIFQNKNNLQSDGIIGTRTLMKLNETLGIDTLLDTDFQLYTVNPAMN